MQRYVVAKVSEKVGRKLAAVSAKHGVPLERLGPNALDVLEMWTREGPNARSPRFTREDIAAAGMHIADAEGFEALSMRRLAAELGAGTMTLYHYIRTKDELLALISDAVMSELILDDAELTGGWRRGLTALAHRSLSAFQKHPWVFDMIDEPTVGPNAVRHIDQSLQAVAELDITVRDKFDIISAIDEYVFGYALQYRNDFVREDDRDGEQAMIAYVTELSRTGDYPQIATLFDELGAEAVWEAVAEGRRDPARFDRNLQRLLDGLAQWLESASTVRRTEPPPVRRRPC